MKSENSELQSQVEGVETALAASQSALAKEGESSGTAMRAQFGQKNNGAENQKKEGQNEENDGKGTAKKRTRPASIRRLANEYWVQVFAWIERTELGEHTSFACRWANSVAHVRMHARSGLFPNDNLRELAYINIVRSENNEPAITRMSDGTPLEWPNTEISENITEIGYILIDYFDGKVREFFEHILQILQSQRLHIMLHRGDVENNSTAFERISPLCENIFAVSVNGTDFIRLYAKFPQLFPQCQYLNIVSSNSNGEFLPKLVEWLSEPRTDEEPKLLWLSFDGGMFIERVKENYSASNVPSPYAILTSVLNANAPVPFNENNLRTGELLSLTVEDYSLCQYYNLVLITRSATRNADRVKELAQKLKNRCQPEREYDEFFDDAGTIEFKL